MVVEISPLGVGTSEETSRVQNQLTSFLSAWIDWTQRNMSRLASTTPQTWKLKSDRKIGLTKV